MEVRQRLGGRYALLDELGSGGMAVVWRARDEVLGRQVAVKVLAGRYAGDQQSRDRIRDEARSAATLVHPNIARVYDYGESDDDNLPYVVMELVDGPTLQQRVASAPLPPRTIFRICGEVAAALGAAHAEGLVHRDVKMANIMVTAAGAKVVDFGIAAAIGPASPEEMLVGTPAYLAPERLTGDDVQPASDIYALGVLMYRLLAKESPWTVETTTQMLRAHVYVEPTPLPELPGVPVGVAELVARCLSKAPQDRPDADEVTAILADAVEAAPTLSRVPRPAGPPEQEQASRHSLAAQESRLRAEEAEEAGGVEEGEEGEEEAADRWDLAATGNYTQPEPDKSHEDAKSEDETAPIRSNKMIFVLAGVIALIFIAAGWALLTGRDNAPAKPVAGRVTSDPATQAGVRPGATATPGKVPAATRLPGRSAGPSNAGPVPFLSMTPLPPSVEPPSDVPSGVTGSPSGSADPDASPGTKVSSPGGTVYANCSQGKARLHDWQPADGYRVEKVQEGPALTTNIVFKSDKARQSVTVTCVGDIPTPVVLPL